MSANSHRLIRPLAWASRLSHLAGAWYGTVRSTHASATAPGLPVGFILRRVARTFRPGATGERKMALTPRSRNRLSYRADMRYTKFRRNHYSIGFIINL